jgi:hypothetical protein
MSYAVEVNNVSMHFNMNKDKIDNLKEYCIKLFKRQLFFEDFTALQDISFKIEAGDTFGIIGLNGSGKSTLLKVISGILKPTTGSVKVTGTIAPLIELGAGFDPDLTARENIFLNGSVLGFSREFMREKFDEIVEFSELQDFVDVPIKNFSSGMVARIGFSVATIVKPDILICDEILAVGDYKFQEKCEQRIKDLMSGGTTVILVSHSIQQVERICNHILWLEHGKMKALGGKELIPLYQPDFER